VAVGLAAHCRAVLWTTTSLGGSMTSSINSQRALALSEPNFAQYLPRAYDYCFTHFVDKTFWGSLE